MLVGAEQIAIAVQGGMDMHLKSSLHPDATP
jgi:hypothetical protein